MSSETSEPNLNIENCNDSEEEEVDLYFIDEVKLKDTEVSLSTEQIEERKKESLEHKLEGNKNFQNGNYTEAADHYTNGLKLCPLCYSRDRAVLYANRAAALIKIDMKKKAIEDCSKAIELDDYYVKALSRRAKLYEDTESLDEALADYKRILEIDPPNGEANSSVIRLKPLIEERNEKLKTEMFGKLKDLGNTFLRPFGLSTDNFQLNQDPNTGGYNIQMKQ